MCPSSLLLPPARFSWLPVTEDVDEAPFVYSFLADLVEANNPHILGANNSRYGWRVVLTSYTSFNLALVFLIMSENNVWVIVTISIAYDGAMACSP